MFGVRIAILVVSLLGVTALLPLDAAEARTRDAYQGSYAKYQRSASVKSYAHTRKSTGHYSSRKSTGHKTAQRASGTSHAGVGARPSRWCGWWMRTQKGGGPELNLARNWARWGRPSGPQIGAVVVWSHHVGMITGRSASGQWIVKSGNDGGRVRERPRSVAGAVFRVA
ncbi:MAG: hypothetical protein WBW51_06235 [Methyloceanibacter sp.]